MQDQLYIPKKVKVGYNKREDTYTKKLAYVIYYDDKGVLRKETSWNSWCDKKLGSDEFENVPTEGFVLNKGVGGQRQSWGWNARNEYIRVYDPRGFEFEISVANLLFILQEATSTKGKGLEGEFVYSWQGKELVLLPVDCQEYKNSQDFTKLQIGKIGAKDLVAGCAYRTKKQVDLIYLGRFEWHVLEHIKDSNNYHDKELVTRKMYIFLNENAKETYQKYVILQSLTNFANKITEVPVSNYAELIEDFNKNNINASKPIELEVTDVKIIFPKENDSYPRIEGAYVTNINADSFELSYINVDYGHKYDNGKYTYKIESYSIHKVKSVTIKNGILKVNDISPKNSNSYWDKPKIRKYTEEEIKSMDFKTLHVKLANGKKMKFDKYN